MLKCPHCNVDIRMPELKHPGLFKNFRICPKCSFRFTVDDDTKSRQMVAIIIMCISLLFTLLLYYRGNQWLTPALISYATLGAIIYWGNKKVKLVPYHPKNDFDF
jgi:uncharacterized paraquat-inducible protein A